MTKLFSVIKTMEACEMLDVFVHIGYFPHD